MISPKMQDAINEQINAETYSAYLYWSMAAYFESENLPGFARWMKVQAGEEMTHAGKFFDYVNERGGRVTLTAIEAPPTAWDSPLAAFQAAYEHETKVTAMINDLVDLARSENDHATESFLTWYVDEQVEEESSADDIVQKLTRVQDAPGGLFMLDRELGARGAGGGE
ncbi:MAG: ferritin [Phycisphaerae bacterium]|nr:ferritin [Phycisphaerae bacterium]